MNRKTQSENNQIRATILVIAGLILSFIYSSYLVSKGAVTQQPLKVGFILVGARSDYGWNYAHDQGRLYLEKNMPGQVTTTVVENVPESAEAERVLEKMIARGNKLIFTTSYGYLEPALRVAARHPDVIIMQCGRSKPYSIKNVGTYFSSVYDPMYVAGIVAGRMTKKNEIGFVAGHPVPPGLSTINAFTLGARSVNPKVNVHVVWTNSWHDPVLEAEASKSLIDQGVDILVANAIDSAMAIVQTAENNHVYSVGCHADLSNLGLKGWLTGQSWEWGPLYVKIVKSVFDHNWRPIDSRYSTNDGYVKLSSFGQVVPVTVRQEALTTFKRIEDGQFIVFKGPLKDREGRLQLPAGLKADERWLANMNFLVSGVQGSLPKSD